MSGTVSQIKEKLDIVTVIGSYLKLEAAGSNWRAACPFHNERTPSFFVSPVRQSFYCFGCQKGGDVISFVEAIEGLDFMGALRLLAEKAGLKLGPINYHRERETERSYAALESATIYYTERLSRDAAALQYFRGRGLSEESIRRWRLGLAGGEWRDLASHLIQTGNFTPAELVKAGLVIERPGRHFDRFRNRLIFPLLDRSGRVISLAGRTFGPVVDPAKYINGPETDLYHKSEFLYGYHAAREAIRQTGRAILVEGYLDLIMAHQVGLIGSVAVSGTALTATHLVPLKRLASTLVLAFDGDDAGRSATLRAARLGLAADFEVLAADLPAGQDPADLAQADPTELKKRVEAAVPVIDWQLRELGRRGLSGRPAIRAVEEEIYPLLASLRSRLDRAHYAGKIAALTGLRDEMIEAELARLSAPPAPSAPASALEAAVPPLAPGRQTLIGERLLGLWWWQKEPAAWREVLEALWNGGLAERLVQLEPRREELVLAVELHYSSLPPEKISALFEELLSEWRQEDWRRRVAEAQTGLRAAEAAGDEVLITSYLAELQQLYEANKKTNQKTKK
jgi:DNA primase